MVHSLVLEVQKVPGKQLVHESLEMWVLSKGIISSNRANLLKCKRKAKEQKVRCPSLCHAPFIQDATRKVPCTQEWVFPSVKAIWPLSVRLPTQMILMCGKVTLKPTIVTSYQGFTWIIYCLLIQGLLFICVSHFDPLPSLLR